MTDGTLDDDGFADGEVRARYEVRDASHARDDDNTIDVEIVDLDTVDAAGAADDNTARWEDDHGVTGGDAADTDLTGGDVVDRWAAYGGAGFTTDEEREGDGADENTIIEDDDLDGEDVADDDTVNVEDDDLEDDDLEDGDLADDDLAEDDLAEDDLEDDDEAEDAAAAVPVSRARHRRGAHAADDEDDDEDEDEDDEQEEELAEHAPKGTGSSLKWGLAAVVLLAVVAVVLVGVVLLGGDPGKDGMAANAGSSGRNAASSGIASADDTGPVAIIIDDPSCTAWTSISTNLANTLALLGHGKWNERDPAIPASQWDDEQKKEYLAAGQVVRTAAAQTVGLVKLTPHRVMRELYEQFIAYSRAFVEHIPNYTAHDASIAGTAHSAASALAAICAATTNGAAASRGPLVEAQSAPTKTASPANPTNPARYLTGPNPVCSDWRATLDKFGADTAEWQGIDPSIPATYWNPQQKATNLAVGPVMISLANKMQQLGRRSNNPTLQDFAELSAQYRRAFVVALPTYDPSDNYLANAATFISTTVLGGCAAVTPAGG